MGMLLWLLALTAACTPAPAPVDGPGVGDPVRIIFDTDMDTDSDDAGAMAMLHAMADEGEVEILGTMVSSRFEWSAPAVDVINTYYGRPDLPIGVPKGAGASTDRGSRFARQLAEEFPHDVRSNEEAEDAVDAYRRILAGQPDGSVVIVTVGYLTNLSDLLRSGPDEHSALSGRELVARKVRHYVAMGSRYPADLDPRVWGNFKPDAAATVHVAAEWPTVITFTGGGDFADRMATGARLATEVPAGSPVRRAYEHYFGGQAEDRHSADQIATLVAVRGTGYPWLLVTEGYNHIFPNGTHEWRERPDDPRHRYVSALAPGADPLAVKRTIEDLMVRPPRRGPRPSSTVDGSRGPFLALDPQVQPCGSLPRGGAPRAAAIPPQEVGCRVRIPAR